MEDIIVMLVLFVNIIIIIKLSFFNMQLGIT